MEPPRPRRGTKSDGNTPTQAVAREDDVPCRAVGEVVGTRYQLVRKLAQGGMGTVWEALDNQLERPVAIKFMSPAVAGDADSRARFSREAKAVARLSTPNVVRIHDQGQDEHGSFIVMERLRGIDLHSRLKQERRIGLEEAARIVAQVAKGLRAAHEANIIHRDLKPQNIFIAQEDGETVAKILDFGVAKVIDDQGESTRTGVLVGSPHYMSPEQARGRLDIDHRSDVWSLGVIAFRMICGKMAFSGEGAGDVIIDLCTGAIPVPSQVVPELGPRIDEFFVRALERDRNKRFASAVDLATAFAQAVRASSEASLLTPALGHPLRPPADSLPQTQPLAIPEPRQPIPLSPIPLGETIPISAPLSAAALDAALYTPSLHTPATGPSIAGAAMSETPPRPPRGRAVGIAIALTAVAGVGAIIAAIAFGGDDPQPPAEAPAAAPPKPTEPPAATEPPVSPARVTEPTAPPSTPSASSKASASSVADKKTAPPAKPKSKDEWDSFGY